MTSVTKRPSPAGKMHSSLRADVLGHCFLPSSAVIDPRPESPTRARRGEEPGRHWRSPYRDCTEPGGTGRAPAAGVHLLEQWEGQLDTSWACSCPPQGTPARIPNFPGYKAHTNSCSTSDFISEHKEPDKVANAGLPQGPV